MIRFECDYGEGAAQPVLDLLQKTNLEQTPGYGMDDYCDQARGLIRKLCDAPDAGVHFFVGATQANFTVVDALLKPWQGVLCADSGHINVHETGAVEATGHKCLALPSVQGKITAQQVRDAYDAHWADASHEHIAQPGMVYISNPTEDGTGSSPYYTRAAKADRQAMRIRAAFEAKGCAMLFDSPTNQQFPILPNSWYNALSEKYAMTLTAKPDAEHTAVRFCTSWATRDEDVDALLADIASL